MMEVSILGAAAMIAVSVGQSSAAVANASNDNNCIDLFGHIYRVVYMGF